MRSESDETINRQRCIPTPIKEMRYIQSRRKKISPRKGVAREEHAGHPQRAALKFR